MRPQHDDQGGLWLKRLYQRYALPLVVGLVATIAVLGLWQQLLVQEHLHMQRLVQQAAETIEVEVGHMLSARIQSLERMATRWQVGGGTPATLWEADAAHHLEDFVGYQAIEWVDSSFRVRWIVPLEGNESAQNLDLSQEPRRRVTLQVARDLRQTLVTRTIALAQGGKGFLVGVPIFVNAPDSTGGLTERFDGFILGVFQFQLLFDSILPPSPRYQVQIYDGSDLIYSRGIASAGQPPYTVIINAYGVDWRVQVMPSPEWIATERSPLPTVMLWGGLITAWTLALVVYLGQRSERHARHARQINRQFQREIEQRQQIEAQLRNLLENSPDIIERFDLHLRHLYVSPILTQLTGLAPEVFLGKTCRDLGMDEQMVSLWESAAAVVLRTAEKQVIEFSVPTLQGLRSFEMAIVPERSDGQTIDSFLCISRDITARNQAEATKQALIESIPDFLVRMRRDGTQIDVLNQGSVQLVQPEGKSVSGTNVTEILPPAIAQERIALTQKALDSGTIQTQEYHFEFEGTVVYEEARIAPLSPDEVLVVVRDISDRHRSEQALRESEARFQAFMDNSPAAAWTTDANGVLLYVSQTYLHTFQLPTTEVIGRSILDLYPSDIAQQFLTNIQTVVRTQQAVKVVERTPRSDGSMGDFLVYKFPIPNKSGHVIVGGVAIDITQQRQAEDALRHSEATKQAIIQAIPDLLIRMRSDGLYIDFISNSQFNIVNPQHLRQDVSVFDILPPDLAQQRLEHAHLALASGVPQIYEHEILIDGKRCYEEIRIVPLQHDEVLVMVRDITDRKQAELDLKAQKAFLQQVIDAVPSSIFVKDNEGRFVIVNQAAASIYGVSISELVGKRDCDFNPDAAQIAEFLEQNRQVHQSASPITFPDQHIQNRAGQMRWYQSTISSLRDTSGRIQGIIGNAIDVSDRKRAEEELRHQKEMLLAIVNHIPVMISLFDAHGRMEFINPEFERILGWSLADWQQQDRLIECYPDPNYRQQVLDFMLVADGRWHDFTTLTASKQTIETAWANVRLSNGRFLGIGQDISDRKHKEIALKRAMEAAEAANLAKSMFLANMSHELRTPLNVILGFAQVMVHDSSLTPSQQEDLQTIRRSGDHLLNLINDILDLSKIEAGHATVEAAGFDLISLLHTLRSMMAERAKNKQIQLTFDIAPDVPQFVISDEQKLRQILLNLLSNAIKFTDQGGVTLTVRVEELTSTPVRLNLPSDVQPAMTLQFQVIDTGVGIAPDEQALIFDAFVQAEAGKKTVSGTGLGLTICRKLVDLMNGTITVHSVPDVGSTFIATIPVHPTSGVNIQPRQQERTVIGLAPGQPHRRILVVDDQPENRQLMVRLLTQLGIEVREAKNGQEAIQKWREWQPDLTWMDIRMPVLDGYEATKQIRAMEQGVTSVIIALTAQASQSDRTLALAAGCNDYLSKPFQEAALFLKMSEYLGVEYIYADPFPDAQDAAIGSDALEGAGAIDLTMLDRSMLPATWLSDLDKAAARCDDRAIADLVNQLPPDYTPIATHLLALANQYQFGKILDLIHQMFSPDDSAHQ